MDLLDLINTLGEGAINLLGPSSAEAATGPTFEQRQQLEQQKAAQTLQLLLEKARIQHEAQAQDPLRQAQVAHTQATTQKTQAGIQPQASLESILGGGQPQAPEGSSIFAYGGSGAESGLTPDERIRTIIDYLSQGQAPPVGAVGPQVSQDFTPSTPVSPGQPFGFKGYNGEIGFDPRTGSFTNVGLPQPEGQTQVPTTPTRSKIDPKALARHTEIVRLLVSERKYTSSEAAKIADMVVPEVADAMQATKTAQNANKPIPIEKLSKLFKYNPETNEFIAAPGDLTEKQMVDQGYRVYDEKIRSKVGELSDVQIAFQQFKSAINDIKNKSAVGLKTSELTGGNFGGPEGAIFKKDATNFTTIFDKFLGGVRGAASPQMQAIRSKVLPQIISSQQVSDRLMSDLGSLIDTMGQERIKTAVGANVALDTKALNSKAEKVLKTAGVEITKGQTGAAMGGAQAQTMSLQPGRVPMVDPQGNPVQVKANDVQKAITQGFKPWQPTQ